MKVSDTTKLSCLAKVVARLHSSSFISFVQSAEFLSSIGRSKLLVASNPHSQALNLIDLIWPYMAFEGQRCFSLIHLDAMTSDPFDLFYNSLSG